MPTVSAVEDTVTRCHTIHTFATPDTCFYHIHLDIVGPLPPSNGFISLLTCLDRFTCWSEPISIADVMAETVANAFVAGLVAQFGVPSIITIYLGGQFQSHLWHQLVQLLGTKQIRTTAYHPIANGLLERFHHQLKVALKCQSIPERCTNSLPKVLLGVRQALGNNLLCSAAKLVYSTTLRLPAKFFQSSGSNTIDQVTCVTKLKEMMTQLRATPPVITRDRDLL